VGTHLRDEPENGNGVSDEVLESNFFAKIIDFSQFLT
jgi:hypothetical protein